MRFFHVWGTTCHLCYIQQLFHKHGAHPDDWVLPFIQPLPRPPPPAEFPETPSALKHYLTAPITALAEAREKAREGRGSQKVLLALSFLYLSNPFCPAGNAILSTVPQGQAILSLHRKANFQVFSVWKTFEFAESSYSQLHQSSTWPPRNYPDQLC